MLLKRRPVFEARPGGGQVESVVFPKPWLEFFVVFFKETSFGKQSGRRCRTMMSPGRGALPKDYSRYAVRTHGSGLTKHSCLPGSVPHGSHEVTKKVPLLSHPGALMGRLKSDGSCCKNPSAHLQQDCHEFTEVRVQAGHLGLAGHALHVLL